MEGEILNADPKKITAQYPVIDSRKVNQETFFVALIGENSDGHDFVAQAIAAGADFALVSKDVAQPAIKVSDPISALMKLASFLRKELKNIYVIGITGSQGKTTAKDMLAQVLSSQGEVISTERSFNNELGLPLTALRATAETKYLILEMGARHLGDISQLAKVAAPQMGIVLVVGNAHIEIFGSRANIAKAKGELIDSLPTDGIAILGRYDEFTPEMGANFAGKKFFFGEEKIADLPNYVRASDLELREGYPFFDVITPNGRASISLQYVGLHQVANALSAITAALALGLELETIASLISLAKPKSAGRMEMFEINDVLLIDDSYNANTFSMAGALNTLAHLASIRGGESWAVLGKMHELGESSLLEHKKVGKIAAENGIDNLVEVGDHGYISGAKEAIKGSELAMEMSCYSASDIAAANEILLNVKPGDVVLFKASRREKFEEIVKASSDFLKTLHFRKFPGNGNSNEEYLGEVE
jgi:UDP-N-acetylmuramoyl-tripeptide--D-alanyl-D-alanine ligase